MKRILFLLLLLLLVSCSGELANRTSIIRIKGSDTMLILANRWAEAFMTSHPGFSVYVEGGGSATGLEAIIDREADIALASRLIRTEEARQMAERYSSIGISYLVAKDALSIYLNRSNPVDNLTFAQLERIFAGEIQNWREVGGEDQPIILAIRPPTSGTYLYFRRFVMEDQPFFEEHRTFSTTQSLIQYIRETQNAIGFGGIAYGEDVKHCAVEGIEPTEANVEQDRYPLARYLYLYTVNRPPRNVREFIDWVIGPEGQSVVDRTGYIPIWPDE